MTTQSTVRSISAIVIVCFAATIANAEIVLIGPTTNNGSFESPAVGSSDPNNNYLQTEPTGWDGSCIIQNSPSGMYDVASEGDQGIALVSYGGPTTGITLAETFQADTIYTLSLDMNGHSTPGVGGQWWLSDPLFTSIEQQAFTTSSSSWEAVTPLVVDTALRPNFVGKTIVAGLSNISSNQLWLDNVRLVATPADPVPPPKHGDWTNRLMPGRDTFLVTGEGRPTGGLAGLQSFTAMLQTREMANALGPFYFPEYENQAYYDHVEALDWTVMPFVVDAKMMWYPDADILAPGHVQILQALDKPDGVATVSLGEWGYHFYHPPDYAGSGYPPPYPGWDPANIPTTKQEAHDFMKAYFQNRVADYKGRVFSTTGHSQYEAYAADWGAQVIGVEISENIAFTQLKFAMTRGAARQADIPWASYVSSYFTSSHTTNGPLVKTWIGGFGWVATGQDAGHSLSFYKRAWLHSWFAGAAILSQEADSWIFYSSEEDPYPITPYGEAAQETFEFMWDHDRGVAYTPAVIIMDKLAGYNSFENGAPWGLTALKTAGDQKLQDLFEKQLFPGSDEGLQSPYRAATLEESMLVATPYGEMFDVLLSSAPYSALGTYKEIILAGDMTFDESFISQLELALANGSNLMLKQEHITAMGPAYYNRLATAGDVETLSDWTNPVTGRDTAISNARLQALSDECLPVDVQGNVQYSINRNDAGWVIELVNNTGVTKLAYAPVEIDPNAVVDVTLTPMFDVFAAELWMVGQADQALPLQSFWTLSIDPGETIFVQLIATILGDANRDGTVDDLDAMVLASHWQLQSGALWEDGDFNGDGAVNDLDATIMASNWLRTIASGASVPEPASLVLCVSAMLAALVIRRRRLS